jgi:hypothetical protein
MPDPAAFSPGLGDSHHPELIPPADRNGRYALAMMPGTPAGGSIADVPALVVREVD